MGFQIGKISITCTYFSYEWKITMAHCSTNQRFSKRSWVIEMDAATYQLLELVHKRFLLVSQWYMWLK